MTQLKGQTDTCEWPCLGIVRLGRRRKIRLVDGAADEQLGRIAAVVNTWVASHPVPLGVFD